MSDRDRQLLADLANHPGWTVLRQRVIKERDGYFTNLAKQLYLKPDETPRDDVLFKSGFFRGMFFLLNQPVFEKKALERAMAQEELTTLE